MSKDEDWPTHRRIIGTMWASRWNLTKVMFAELPGGGDPRVADFVWSASVDSRSVVAHGVSSQRRQQKQQQQKKQQQKHHHRHAQHQQRQ